MLDRKDMKEESQTGKMRNKAGRMELKCVALSHFTQEEGSRHIVRPLLDIILDILETVEQRQYHFSAT